MTTHTKHAFTTRIDLPEASRERLVELLNAPASQTRSTSTRS